MKVNHNMFDGELPAAKAYLFDMDGTIVNNCAYHVKAWKEFSSKHGNELSERQIIDWMGATNREYNKRILGREVSAEESAKLEVEKELIYQELYKSHMRLSPGLPDFLDAARSEGIKCAIASGAPRMNIDFILDGLGLHKYFQGIIDASSYVNSKPAPDCYLAAADCLGVDPKDCMVFEDAVAGIESGLRAGMFVVAITQTNSREILSSAKPNMIIDTFDDIRPARISRGVKSL